MEEYHYLSIDHDILLDFWWTHHDDKFQSDTVEGYEKFQPFHYVAASFISIELNNDYLVFIRENIVTRRYTIYIQLSLSMSSVVNAYTNTSSLFDDNGGQLFPIHEIKKKTSLHIRNYTHKTEAALLSFQDLLVMLFK